MPKFKFKSMKKQKFNLIKDRDEIISNDLFDNTRLELFSNKNAIIEGCKSIVDYQNNYIKLKLKKGFLTLSGCEFLIVSFENETIIVKGNILQIDFCV